MHEQASSTELIPSAPSSNDTGPAPEFLALNHDTDVLKHKCVYTSNSFVHFNIIVVSAALALDAILMKTKKEGAVFRKQSLRLKFQDENATPSFSARGPAASRAGTIDNIPAGIYYLCWDAPLQKSWRRPCDMRIVRY